MATKGNDEEELSKRLDLIIHLLCLLVDPKRLPTTADEISLLLDRGLAPAEIGRIIGREANYVSAYATKAKKRGLRNAT